MKIHHPSDIEVGATYTHPDLGVDLLGVGMRKLWTIDEFEFKHLARKDSGLLIQEGENAREGLWEIGFEKK